MNMDKVKPEITTEFPFVVTSGNCKVKIYRVKGAKNKNGWTFQVADYTKATVDGKSVRKLVSFADFAEAKAYATKTAKLLSTGDTLALQMRGPEAAEYGSAVSILKPAQTPLLLAVTRYAEAVKILGDGEKVIEAAKYFAERHRVLNPTMTVPQLTEEMLALKMSRNKSDRYVQDLRSRLGKFKSDFPCKLVDVDTARVQKWLDGYKQADGKSISAQSYNNYRAVVHALFAFAEKRGYIAKGTNPVESVERQTIRDRNISFFTPDQFAALLNVSSPDFRPSLAIGGFAGLRSAEIQRLEWAAINLQRRKITLNANIAKTASRRVIDICDALAEWLSPYAGATGNVWNGNGDDFVNEQRRTAKKAKMKWKGNALRHSAASYLFAQTGDVIYVARQLGNSPSIVERHYKEIVTPEDATTWFNIRPSTPANVTQIPSAAVG